MCGRWNVVVLIGVLAAGCGSDDGPDLDGTWVLETPDGCAFGATFEGSKYEYDYICELQSGAIGIQAEVGTFQVSGNQLTTTASHASCEEVTKVETSNFKIEGSQLTLSNAMAAIILQRLPKMPGMGSAAAVFGCYDGDNFTPRAISPVP